MKRKTGSRGNREEVSLEFFQSRVLDELIDDFEGKDLTRDAQDYLFHILTTYAKSPPAYVGDDFKFRIIRCPPRQTQIPEMFNSNHHVPGRYILLVSPNFDIDQRYFFRFIRQMPRHKNNVG